MIFLHLIFRHLYISIGIVLMIAAIIAAVCVADREEDDEYFNSDEFAEKARRADHWSKR